MEMMKLLLLGMVCLGAYALPNTQRAARNTVFLDEKLEGEIFENLMNYNEVSPRNEAANVFRLPTTTKPYHYDIYWIVDTDPASLDMRGTVNIQLYATQENVREIVLQSHELNIADIQLRRNGVLIPQSHYFQPELDFLIIELADGTLEYSAIPTLGLYDLTIEFGAELRHDMYGIYRNWFRNENTDPISYMASTQFQATAGRSAFPCYDEPSFKATFDITITRRRTDRSWSCMRQIETRNSSLGDAFEEDLYYRTPIMSTYLLAIIVANYESVGINNANGDLMYEVVARPSAIRNNQHVYALEFGQELLNVMNEHTNINFYSVNENLKMTQAAIPDFGAGAMENWGLLTYREAYLMYDENHTNSNYKQIIAYILSHEIAHMWFGNLVTNEWWDVLWLNEGFARYYQYFLTHWADPELGMATRFITEQIHTSLLSDSVASAHPLTNPGVGSKPAVSAMFSTISYNKGAAVIRMTEHLLGFDIHREGLRKYLVDYSFDVALPIDLFTVLEEVGREAGALNEYGPDFSLIEYYKLWTEQFGHPVLNVQVDHQTGQMTISQRRFDLNNGFGASDNWIVPITFATASNPDFENTKPTHIIKDGLTIINRGSVGDEWVIFNKQQTGFYRINYDDYTWNLIALALNGPQRTTIHEYNRAQIVNDVFQFARSGLMSYNRAFSILSFLSQETSYTPWVAAMTGFTWLRNRFASSPANLATLHNLIINWSAAVMADLTYYPTNNESFMRSYLRVQIAPIMCIMGVPACRAAATAQFQQLYNSPAANLVEVPVDSRAWVYCNALRDGPAEYFDYLWTRFQTHQVYTEKILLLSVLGCTPYEDRLRIFLNAIMQDNYLIRAQDYSTAFSSAVTGNEANTQIVFRYVQENLELVQAAYNVTSNIASPLSTISARLRTNAEIDQFQAWARQNRLILGDYFNSVVSSAESVRAEFDWLAENSEDVISYVVGGGETISTTSQAPVVVTQPTTVNPPVIIEPVTPDLPERDSAVTTVMSVVVVAIATIANLAL